MRVGGRPPTDGGLLPSLSPAPHWLSTRRPRCQQAPSRGVAYYVIRAQVQPSRAPCHPTPATAKTDVVWSAPSWRETAGMHPTVPPQGLHRRVSLQIDSWTGRGELLRGKPTVFGVEEKQCSSRQKVLSAVAATTAAILRGALEEEEAGRLAAHPAAAGALTTLAVAMVTADGAAAVLATATAVVAEGYTADVPFGGGVCGNKGLYLPTDPVLHQPPFAPAYMWVTTPHSRTLQHPPFPRLVLAAVLHRARGAARPP